MFQSYTLKTNKAAGAERLKKLRSEMKAEGVTAFVIPHADEHQNEYLPERAERLAWLTGFTGSAGMAIATHKKCQVFVDGRYTLQVQEQIDLDAFTPESLIDYPPTKWVEDNVSAKDVVGLDPWLTTINQFKTFEKACAKSGAKLKLIGNLVDRIWHDQPGHPMGKVALHPVKFSGFSAAKKIKQIQNDLRKKQADLTILTDPASLAWLFNIRGSDLVHNPLALGYAILPAKAKPALFLDAQKLTANVKTNLESIAQIKTPKSLKSELAKGAKGKKVLCDPGLVSVALSEVIKKSKGKIIEGRDPVVLPRAIKNDTELSGARTAHQIDGVAMCKFLCWLDHQVPAKTTEIDAAKKLEEIRIDNAKSMNSKLMEISFDTISGSGPNGAIVHYRVTEDSNRKFKSNSLYLCDSGGQYREGTTDITRTVAIGKPPRGAVTDFTLVLKGHIAIAQARFPEGSRGVDIDVLARHALWQHGKDFAHGTGHGVGAYLNVHEGPQSISKRGMEKLVPGMIISNEPGFYVEGKYGIRIENLVVVEEATGIKGGNCDTHTFETITLCPIDTRLVDKKLLTKSEIDWLNRYHTEVRKKLSKHLKGAELAWLKNATKPI